jgi:hypothetical protein
MEYGFKKLYWRASDIFIFYKNGDNNIMTPIF